MGRVVVGKVQGRRNGRSGCGDGEEWCEVDVGASGMGMVKWDTAEGVLGGDGKERCEVDGGAGGTGTVEVKGETAEGVSVHRIESVEGTQVPDIVLDTGCSLTMVRQDLVPEERKLTGEAIMLRCVH